MLSHLQVSPARAKVVIDEITAGSDTHIRFYALLIVSSMIACFGLATNSTAVIIGAMLVSPLMTPIFGVALGMLEGDTRLLSRALLAETVGVILAIGSAFLVGMMQFTGGEATTEMLIRTQPNLLDLLVAIFAGFAGAYALVDERISPALPGVAIATAIVPPLSVCGLCLSMGAWTGALGAFLLFLANFVSILIVALSTFAISGLARPRHIKSWRRFARRFSLPALVFAVLAVVLTHSLAKIMDERFTEHTIRKTLVAQLVKDHAVDLEEFKHNQRDGRVEVLAIVRSPRIIKSSRVSEIQRSIGESLQRPVDLVVRTVVAKDVTPRGSSLQVTRLQADGSFLSKRADDQESREGLAEQVIRESFEYEPGFELTNVDVGRSSDNTALVLAYVNTIRRLTAREIGLVEEELQRRLKDPGLMLVLRVNASELEYRGGPIRVEWTKWRGVETADIAEMPAIQNTIREIIEELVDVIPLYVHLNVDEKRQAVLAEVVGPSPVTPADALLVQKRLSKEFNMPIEFHFLYRNEFVVNADGYTTYHRISDPERDDRTRQLRAMFAPKSDPADPIAPEQQADPVKRDEPTEPPSQATANASP